MSIDALRSDVRELCRFLLASKAEFLGIAPGRVEILGNHTDYNEGFVLTAAIDRYTVVAGRATDGQAASVYSDAYERLLQFRVDDPQKDGTAPWLNYPMGVVDTLRKSGRDIQGFEAAIASDVPVGAGLSSSASLELATALFLDQAFSLGLSREELARLCQRAENEFVGMNCGIMDQWSSLCGEPDSLLCIDCRDLSTEVLPFGEGAPAIVLADTKAEHALVDGAYNRLREGCHKAAGLLSEKRDGLSHLRDVSLDELAAWEDALPDELRPLARHVVGENDRVLRGVAALKEGDLAALGQLLYESHCSSRENFENSCPELDLMVNLALAIDGCYGARLSGGGFGGCTVNLVEAGKAVSFAADLAEAYKDETGIAPEMHICRASRGAFGEPAGS